MMINRKLDTIYLHIIIRLDKLTIRSNICLLGAEIIKTNSIHTIFTYVYMPFYYITALLIIAFHICAFKLRIGEVNRQIVVAEFVMSCYRVDERY